MVLIAICRVPQTRTSVAPRGVKACVPALILPGMHGCRVGLVSVVWRRWELSRLWATVEHPLVIPRRLAPGVRRPARDVWRLHACAPSDTMMDRVSGSVGGGEGLQTMQAMFNAVNVMVHL